MTLRLIRIAAALLGLAAPVRADVPLDLAWQPVAPGPAMIALDGGTLVLSFANACFAEAGVHLTLLSAPGQPDALIVEAAPTQQGCPEIFQPVRARLALPEGVTIEADRVFARRPAEGQPAGPETNDVAADLTRQAMPSITWMSAQGGVLSLAQDCGAGDVTARLFPGSVTASGQAQGVLSAPVRCLDSAGQRTFRLDAPRPPTMLNAEST